MIPEIVIDYHARDTLGKMSQMYYQYGLFKPLVNRKLGSPATLRQLVPPLFVSAIISGIVLSVLFPMILPVFAGGLALYLLISCGVSLIEASRQSSLSLIFLLPVVFLIIHFSYGWGYLNGIMKFMIFKTKSVTAEVNR